MAFITVRTGSTGISSRIDGFFAGLGQGCNAYLESRARRDEIARLDAMSDGELARLGLTRDQIVAHVFRDRFGY